MTHDEAKALIERVESYLTKYPLVTADIADDTRALLTLARRGLAADKLAEALEHLSQHNGDLAHFLQVIHPNEEAITEAYHKARYAKEIATKALAAYQSDTGGEAVLAAPGPDIPAHIKRNAEWKRPEGEPDLTWDEGREGRREGAEEDPADPSTTEAGASWPENMADETVQYLEQVRLSSIATAKRALRDDGGKQKPGHWETEIQVGCLADLISFAEKRPLASRSPMGPVTEEEIVKAAKAIERAGYNSATAHDIARIALADFLANRGVKP